LVCLGRHTVTGWLGAAGKQFEDWSAAYRLFAHERFADEPLFAPARQAVSRRLRHHQPLVALMDDTLIKKTGRKVTGGRWLRDPLGPPFQTNLIWGQRFVQISAALPEHDGPARARAIPIDWRHCPAAKKPRPHEDEKTWRRFRQAQRQLKLSQCGVERLAALRHAMDREQQNRERTLVAAADGSYTNRTVFKHLPQRTVLIGRIRKDAKLFALPDPGQDRGRPRVYGKPMPTPEQLRRDAGVGWKPVRAYAAGKIHTFQIKTMAPVRWRGVGAQHNLRVVVIRSLKYRPTKNGPTLYRQPAYLICTDPDLPLDELVQYYLWRWEIELNFRDEKTLIGVGEAQVQTPDGVEKAPQLAVAAYAYMLLAAEQLCERERKPFARPKWRKPDPGARISTSQLISLFRGQLWGLAMRHNLLSHFDQSKGLKQKSEKIENQFHSAVIYATR
jgi:hypothetical protein